MLHLTLLKDDLPLLEFLHIPFTVIKNTDSLTNMVDCEMESGGAVVIKLIEARDKANLLSKQLQRA